MSVHGIIRSMLDEAPPLADVLNEFADGTKGLPLVGHGVLRFDAPFLRSAARRHAQGLQRKFADSRFIDTAALFKARQLFLDPRPGESHVDFARRVLKIRARGVRFSLDFACQQVGVATDDLRFHRASGDVTATFHLFQKLREEGILVDGLSE